MNPLSISEKSDCALSASDRSYDSTEEVECMMLTARNPATGERLRDYQAMTTEEALDAANESHRAFLEWRRSSFEDRSTIMKRVAEVLRSRRGQLAELMALEMGKPITQGASEVDKCAWVCEHYAGHGAAYLEPESVATEASRSFVACRPLGVILAIMPWNFPFWQVFRFAAPALMAGNTALLKHASNVPGCALAIEDIFNEASLPSGVFRTVLIGSDEVGALIDHERIAAVTLTGSAPAGREVAARAGRALKKTLLELGGSDPYVVLENADIRGAARACVTGRLINSGQSCIAAKRFIVLESVREEFEQSVVEMMAAAAVGDPLDGKTEVGPLARSDLREELHGQVQRSIASGARCLLCGAIPDGPGFFYPSTVLTDVQPGMPAHDEELFGPVAAIVPVSDEKEALMVANSSSFGLGAAVFTSDSARGERLAVEELDAGCCFVNDFVRSDPRLPFGGIKESGYGRELAREGIREFVNIKTIWTA